MYIVRICQPLWPLPRAPPPQVVMITKVPRHRQMSPEGAKSPRIEPRHYTKASQILRCIGIAWGPCSDVDTESVGLGWRFCISGKLPGDARAAAPRAGLWTASSSHLPTFAASPPPAITQVEPGWQQSPYQGPSLSSQRRPPPSRTLPCSVPCSTFSLGGAEGRWG